MHADSDYNQKRMTWLDDRDSSCCLLAGLRGLVAGATSIALRCYPQQPERLEMFIQDSEARVDKQAQIFNFIIVASRLANMPKCSRCTCAQIAGGPTRDASVVSHYYARIHMPPRRAHT